MSSLRSLPHFSFRSCLEEDKIVVSEDFLLNCFDIASSWFKHLRAHTFSHPVELLGIESECPDRFVLASRSLCIYKFGIQQLYFFGFTKNGI